MSTSKNFNDLTIGQKIEKSNTNVLAIIMEKFKEQLLAERKLNETCASFTNGTYCDDRPLYRLLMGQIFMLMLFLCVFGNCISLFIYHSEQMRQFLAIRMLSAKVLLNTLLMLCILPQALRSYNAWFWNSEVEALYWQTWPYQMYIMNVLGYCSMWLTVLITLEYYMHVAFPMYSKAWCTEANACKCSIFMVLVAMTLHLIYPLNRIIGQLSCPGNRTFYTVAPGSGKTAVALEKIYALVNLLLSIIIPLTLLTFMSVFVAWRLLFKHSSLQHRHSGEKTCVTRITLVTMALQIICEGPAVPVLIIAAVAGPAMHDVFPCYWYTIAHFLGLCNLSLSFYVYLIFSDKFRSLVAAKFENSWCAQVLTNLRGIELPPRPLNEESILLKKAKRTIRVQSCVTESTTAV